MQIGLIVTLRYPGRGLGGRQSEVNSQSLEFSLQKCHATGRPPPQLRWRPSSFWQPLRKGVSFATFSLKKHDLHNICKPLYKEIDS